MPETTINERRFRFLMWRWTRRLHRNNHITDEQAENILHTLRENPSSEDEGCFLSELQTAVALTMPAGVGVTVEESSGTSLFVAGVLSNIFTWLLDNWQQILEIVLFLISLF